jgi:membrane protease YdiL (CAAX protease family)
MIFLMAVVVAPVVEELMYRVAVFGGMYQRNSFGIGLVISSILFGLAHGYPDCLALLPLAVAIGFTYSRRRSYRTAVLIHFLFNGFNMMLAGVSMI